LEDLEKGRSDKVIATFAEIKKIITHPGTMRFVMTSSEEYIDRLVSGLQGALDYGYKYLEASPTENSLPKLKHSWESLAKLDDSHGFVITVPGAEGASLYSGARGVPHYLDPEYPAYLLAQSYMNVIEGPFWKRVRGNGLAYDSGMGGAVDDGRLILSINDATNVVDAYVEMIHVLKQFDSGELKFEEDQLEAIKSSSLYGHVTHISSPGSIASSRIWTILSDLPRDYVFELMEKIQKTTAEEMLAALKKHFVKLTEAESTNLIITCGPAEAPAIIQAFQEKTGRLLKLFTSDNFNDYMKEIGRW